MCLVQTDHQMQCFILIQKCEIRTIIGHDLFEDHRRANNGRSVILSAVQVTGHRIDLHVSQQPFIVHTSHTEKADS